MSHPDFPRPAFIPRVIYKDNRAALDWLQKAFGFEVSELLVDSQDNIAHVEMSYSDGVVMIGNEWSEWTKSPANVAANNTQFVQVRIQKGIDEHCARARAAGAKIVNEPSDQFYGDRTYLAVDPEGHHWAFAQSTRTVTREEMEAATGFKFKPAK